MRICSTPSVAAHSTDMLHLSWPSLHWCSVMPLRVIPYLCTTLSTLALAGKMSISTTMLTIFFNSVMYGVTKVPDDWFEKIPVLGVIYKPKHDAREKHLSLLTPSSSHHSSRHHSRHQSREDHKTSEDGHEHKRRSHKHRHHSSHKSGDRHNDKRRHENKRDPDRHIEHIDTNDQGQRFIAPIAYSPAAYAQSPVSPVCLATSHAWSLLLTLTISRPCRS